MTWADRMLLTGVAGLGLVQAWVALQRPATATAAPLAIEATSAPVQVAPAVAEAPPPEEEPSTEENATEPEPEVPLLGDQWMEETVAALVANQPNLALTDEEKARLQEVYVYCQNVRTAFEAELAKVETVSADRARIHIPPYPVAGARLQQMWNEELAAELGEERYGDVDDWLGDTFELAFKWFGASNQVLDVELQRAETGELQYRIVARMDFADAVDPELGMNETRLFSTRAEYRLRAETVATGEWRPLAKFFPRLPES